MSYRRLFSLFFCFFISASANSSGVAYEYKKIEKFSDFLSENIISLTESDERVMKHGSFVDVDVVIRGRPEAGQFYLVHFLIQGLGYNPVDITHSVFVGDDKGRVVNSYATPTAASALKSVDVGKVVRIQAMHLYNFSEGPRFVIMTATPLESG